MSDMDTVPGSSSTTESTDDGARSFTAIAKRPSVQIAEPPNSATNASKEKMRSKGQGGAASTAATVGSREAGNQADSTAGAPVKRSYSLSKHPLFQDKARGLRLRIMRFTPSWYSVTMGTGIVNTLLFLLPWQATHAAFRGIGAAFLLGDIFLFICFSILTVLRYALYPIFFKLMLSHETHSLFLGCIPMGAVTIVSGIANLGHEYGIAGSLDAAMVLWWCTLVMSVLTSFGVPFVMFTQHNHTPEALTAAWLLPVVPPITIAAVGSTLCRYLILDARYDYALTVLIASYVMCGVGLLVACGLMVIYFQRLAIHRLPPREVIVSTFLPLGPCGQGGYSLVELGRRAVDLFPMLAEVHPDRAEIQVLAQLGHPLLGAGLMSGMLLWGLGMWWAFLAVASVSSHYIGKTVTFNMGWWAFTFPIGSLTLLTFSLGELFDSMFFKVVATIMTACIVALWTMVMVPTTLGFFRGTLFPAPCLTRLPREYVEKLPGGKGYFEAEDAG